MISDEIRRMKERIPELLALHMDEVAQNMVDSMKQYCPVDTGKLRDSIHAETEKNQTEIVSNISVDARSEDGTWYAEFVEYGTGAYNENGDGRQTPWKWQDKDGGWHTTTGMKAHPFIRPGFSKHIGELEDGIPVEVMNLRRYKK